MFFKTGVKIKVKPRKFVNLIIVNALRLLNTSIYAEQLIPSFEKSVILLFQNLNIGYTNFGS
jgi:hypothetical protein